ncbi:MAG TPA: DUF5929 domain-containing protein, partial [Salinimicrobium sp.]|nr:DUF5929 domain-containing protein [Salinimicrobium sp.]
SKIQNLVNAYIENPPRVIYENIPFPHLPENLVVGLITIRPNGVQICVLKKNIWKYSAGTRFVREGSISLPKENFSESKNINSEIVSAIENHSQNNIELTLDGVFDFRKKRKDFNPQYKVFKEYFVVCWAGKEKWVKDQVYYSRVDIELINEQVKLFYSELDEVSISIDDDVFQIVEYVHLGLAGSYKYYPLEEVKIQFQENGNYEILNKILFEAPQFDKKTLHHIYNSNNAILEKLKKKIPLSANEEMDLNNLPATYLICYFNNFSEAKEKLDESKIVLKNYNEKIYAVYKEVMRIFRKIKYSS